jgi:hypothetical protein
MDNKVGLGWHFKTRENYGAVEGCCKAIYSKKEKKENTFSTWERG